MVNGSQHSHTNTFPCSASPYLGFMFHLASCAYVRNTRCLRTPTRIHLSPHVRQLFARIVAHKTPPPHIPCRTCVSTWRTSMPWPPAMASPCCDPCSSCSPMTQCVPRVCLGTGVPCHACDCCTCPHAPVVWLLSLPVFLARCHLSALSTTSTVALPHSVRCLFVCAVLLPM